MPLEVHGYCNPKFEPVAREFEALWDDIEVGASVCVYVRNEKVVSLWGGYCDAAQTRPWQRDTLANIYSTTKGIVALAVAMLVDRGKLQYEDPVAAHWPEFGAENKHEITVAQLLSHQAGLFDFTPQISVNDLYDWGKMVFNLAAQKPRWHPGTAFGYHAITWGYLAGELIRRVTGITPGQFIRNHIAGPLDADLYLGLPAELHERCADLIGPNRARKPLISSRQARQPALIANDPAITPFGHACSTEYRSAEIPATNGHASAEGLARCYNAALSGQLLSKPTLEIAISEVTRDETDLVLAQQLRRAQGFLLGSTDIYFGNSARAYGHPGTGGSTGFADPDSQVAFGYVMNQLHVDGPLRSRKLIEKLYSVLETQ